MIGVDMCFFFYDRFLLSSLQLMAIAMFLIMGHNIFYPSLL
jgi:hypothetical protein